MPKKEKQGVVVSNKMDKTAVVKVAEYNKHPKYHKIIETHKNYNRIQAFTAGAGLNFGMFYCDAAFIHKFSENETVFYSYYDIQAEPVKNKYLSNEARITLGIRF